MRRSFIRGALGKPAYREDMSPAQWIANAKLRALLVFIALLVDVALVAALRTSTKLDTDVLRAFAAINIPLLSIDLLVALAMLRFPALRRAAVLAALGVIETFTIAVWLQATGTLTSYFMFVAALLLVYYRVAYGYVVGAITTLAMIAFHGGAVALELAEVLAPKQLFLSAPGPEYTEPLYQGVLCGSILSVYFVLFAAANVFMNRQRQHDLALAEMRREASRAARRVQHGRLTGSIVADDYAMGELLGRGGMGEVYSAERVSDGEQVALKVLHGHLLGHDTVLARFRREAATANRIPDVHTARIFEVGRDPSNEVDFIAMEYLRGEDLSAFLRRRGIPDPSAETIPLLREVAIALDAAHTAGVVHRDMKPQNIFLLDSSDGAPWPQIRLLDFGMSKMIDTAGETLTNTGAVIGTIAYMSPEQALGQIANVGPASDRFSFAAIAYRILTGRLPFEAPNMVEAIQYIAHVQPPPPSSLAPTLHPDVDAVIAIGLAKQSGDRYTTASAMAEDLARALAGELDPGTRDRARVVCGAMAAIDPKGATITMENTGTE